MSDDPASRARAAAWQQHLREGGTTRWGDFSGSATSDVELASAVHLELVRRLDSSLPQFTALADLVLTTPAPGRGSVDVPLPGSTANPYGAPPVDPASLPATELSRVALGVLDRLIGTPVATPPDGSGIGLLPRKHFQVSGTPVSCQIARGALLRAGWREHPRRARHFVFGAQLPDAVAQLWSDRVTRGATASWPEFWRRLATREELPRRLRFEDLTRAAGTRAIPCFGTLDDVIHLLEHNHGLQIESPAASLDLVATSLTRRLNGVLATRMNREERRRATPVIVEIIGRSDAPITRLRVPGAQQGWARAQQAREPDYPQDASDTAPTETRLRAAHARVGRRGDRPGLDAPSEGEWLMASKVLLHVGTPKTGTSFVQDLLFSHREALREEGILYAADRFDAHFLAALDLMQLPWGGLEREAIGRWDALAAQVRDFDGVAIISHEILGRASRLQVARALESLGDAEVHLVLSARDLARQLPAEWQENLKHRRTIRFGDFIAKMQDRQRKSEIAQWFWAVQEVPDILDRWGSTLPRKHVHLITVPKPGAARELLWQRFAGVLGIDTGRYVPADEPANASLGVPEAALIRRLNEKVNGNLPNHHYRAYVRELLVHQNLSHDRHTARLALPAEVHEWANQLSRSWVAEVALRGYDVVGQLDDLLPDEPETFVDPDQPDEAKVADAAVRALAVSIDENARLREVEIELHEIIDDLAAALDRARSTRIYRAKEKFVRMSDDNAILRLCLRIYRRLRSSSRSA